MLTGAECYVLSAIGGLVVVKVTFKSEGGEVLVCEDGAGVGFDEDEAKKVLSCDTVIINIELNDGEGFAEAYGCDLTYDYVKINGDYRT